MKSIYIILILCLSICFALLAADAAEQPRPNAAVRTEAYRLSSGVHDNLTGSEPVVAYSEVVRVRDAAWIRLHFGDFHLGENSFIKITSIEDGARQHLDATSIDHYRHSSAYFNGDAVELALYVAPGDRGIYINLKETTVRDRTESDFGIRTLCDENDSRVPSTDPAVGRVLFFPMPVDTTSSGTAWIGSNGALLTAGHIVPVLELVQFNVPLSECDGTMRHPPPEFQFAPDLPGVQSSNDGDGEDCPGPDCGQDWAVFSCFPNSETGLSPALTQEGHFYRMSRDDTAMTVVVTGFGDDITPMGCDPAKVHNERSRAQQTDFGPYIGEHIESPSDVVLEHKVDTAGGNSGSPIIPFGMNRAIGIHTDGGCDRPNTGNFGTGFENNALEAALQTWYGPIVVHVDAYQWTTGDGTIFKPFATITDTFKDPPIGGVICIVRGIYSETFLISEPMTLMAPVGTVIIGQ